MRAPGARCCPWTAGLWQKPHPQQRRAARDTRHAAPAPARARHSARTARRRALLLRGRRKGAERARAAPVLLIDNGRATREANGGGGRRPTAAHGRPTGGTRRCDNFAAGGLARARPDARDARARPGQAWPKTRWSPPRCVLSTKHGVARTRQGKPARGRGHGNAAEGTAAGSARGRRTAQHAASRARARQPAATAKHARPCCPWPVARRRRGRGRRRAPGAAEAFPFSGPGGPPFFINQRGSAASPAPAQASAGLAALGRGGGRGPASAP